MILNLTQHAATKEQIEDGVIEPNNKQLVQELLTFLKIPTREEIQTRAKKLAIIAANHGVTSSMIGGAPYLMGHLENELSCLGIKSVYSFTERVSVEETLQDGSVRKTNVFKHVGFV